jgi:hypothetical protein
LTQGLSDDAQGAIATLTEERDAALKRVEHIDTLADQWRAAYHEEADKNAALKERLQARMSILDALNILATGPVRGADRRLFGFTPSTTTQLFEKGLAKVTSGSITITKKGEEYRRAHSSAA